MSDKKLSRREILKPTATSSYDCTELLLAIVAQGGEETNNEERTGLKDGIAALQIRKGSEDPFPLIVQNDASMPVFL